MANKQNRFQKTSYLLGKIIFTLKFHDLSDSETDRKLCSYHLKTVYLFTLEETPQTQFEKLEKAKEYLRFTFVMLERLSKALKSGYLPCYFAQEMNLLQGFDRGFLDAASSRVDNIFDNGTVIGKLLEQFKAAPILSHVSEEEN